MPNLSKIGVVIPTLNAERFLEGLLPALLQQGIPASNILVIDSASDDATAEKAREFGVRLETIARRDFNHGGTRRYSVHLMAEFDVLVFLTQDAMPASDDALQRLVEAFGDPQVGMAYGRQLPRHGAAAIERHARLRNYPARSEVRSFGDRHRLGVRTVFCSNSFAAYRRVALEAIGGFPEDAFFAEDQVVAGRMLMAGWKLAYQADASVYHSHGYSMRDEFRRYFDVGVFHARNSWILESFGHAEGEGAKFVLSELKYVGAHEPLSIPSALIRTGLKYAAYKMGRREQRLSLKWKARLSMQPWYWSSRPGVTAV